MKFKLNKLTCFSTFILIVLAAIFLVNKFGFWFVDNFSSASFFFLIASFFALSSGIIASILSFPYKEFKNDRDIQTSIKFLTPVVFFSSIVSFSLMIFLLINYLNRLEYCWIWIHDKQKIEFMAEITNHKREMILKRCLNKSEDKEKVREKVLEIVKKYCYINENVYDSDTPLSTLKDVCLNEINIDIGNVIFDKNKEDYINFLFEKKERLIRDLKQFNL